MSIASLLNSTETDFTHLYQAKRASCYKREFLHKCEKMQQRALLDAQKLADFGVSHKELAARLKNLTSLARQDEKEEVTIGIFLIKKVSTDTSQECFWCQTTTPDPISFFIQNSVTKRAIQLHETTIHLIENHNFFGETHRLDPIKACEVLGINEVEIFSIEEIL